MKLKRNISFFLFLFVVNSGLIAQVAQVHPAYVPVEDRSGNENMAIQSIQDLASSTLIVRIPSKAKKIAELQSRIDEGSINSTKYKRMLDNTIEDRTDFAYMIMSAYEEEYNFSEVLFIWDSTQISSNSGVISGIFLDKGLEQMPDKSIDTNTPYFYTFIGNTSLEVGQGINAWIIADADMTPLKSPFPFYSPYNFGTDTLKMLLFVWVSKADILKDSIEKLNRNLGLYQERVNR